MRFRNVRVGARHAASILMAGLLSGCLSTVRSPALSPPIQLVSPENFTLYATDPSTTRLVPHCVVRTVDASVLGVAGDTLLLTGVRVLESAPAQPTCARSDSLRLLIGSDSRVQAKTMEPNLHRSIWAAVLLTPTFLLGLLAILFIAGGGSSS